MTPLAFIHFVYAYAPELGCDAIAVSLAFFGFSVQQAARYGHGPAGVEYVDGSALGVSGLHLQGGMRLGGRRSADQQGGGHAPPFHLCGYGDHLVERRRDEPTEADDVGIDALGFVQDLIGRYHHTEVDDLVVVARQDNPDDVLTDVVDVAFYGGQEDGAFVLAGNPLPQPLPTGEGRCGCSLRS